MDHPLRIKMAASIRDGKKGEMKKDMNKSERQDLNLHCLLPRQACYQDTLHPVIVRRSPNGAGGPLPTASIHQGAQYHINTEIRAFVLS